MLRRQILEASPKALHYLQVRLREHPLRYLFSFMRGPTLRVSLRTLQLNHFESGTARYEIH